MNSYPRRIQSDTGKPRGTHMSHLHSLAHTLAHTDQTHCIGGNKVWAIRFNATVLNTVCLEASHCFMPGAYMLIPDLTC